jgi:photosystem II stability/assembly factor-like uncharacterized protein
MKIQNLLLTIALLAGCGFTVACDNSQTPVSSENIFSTPIQAQPNKSAIEILSTVPTATDTYDIGYRGIALRSNDEMWSTGGWNAKTGYFYRSIDKGKTWQAIKLPVNFFGVNGEIAFVDSQNGWAIGSLNILRTTDGGASWEPLKLPKDSKITELGSVQFFNSQIGYIAGRTMYRNEEYEGVRGLEILCTQDGGTTWNICYKTDKRNSVFQVITLSETAALALADGNYILRTEDSGKTWQETNFPEAGGSIAKSSDGHIWKVGSKGSFEYSQDRGQIWSKVSSFAENNGDQDWLSIDFNDDVGIAVGKKGIIALTTDNGQSWKLFNKLVSDDLYDVKIRDLCAVILGKENLYIISIK